MYHYGQAINKACPFLRGIQQVFIGASIIFIYSLDVVNLSGSMSYGQIMDSTFFADFLSNNGNLKIRKMLANSYLREGRFSNSLKVYCSILSEGCEDIDILVVLGTLYLAAGSSMTAYCLFSHVLELDPDNLAVQHQHMLAGSLQHGSQEEPVPLSMEAIERLAARLENIRDPNCISAIRSAADMLERAISNENRDQIVSIEDENYRQLLPALIEVKIRDARAAGMRDLAETLVSLRISLAHRTES